MNKHNDFRKNFMLGIVILLMLVSSLTGCIRNQQGTKTTTEIVETSPSESTIETTQPVASPTTTVVPVREFEHREERRNVALVSGKDNVFFLSGGETVEVQGTLDTVEYSGDRDSAAVLLDRSGDGTGRLIFFDGKTVKEIASDVICFRVSCDGNTIAYLIDSKKDNQSGILYIYSREKDAPKLLDASAGVHFALSPSGSAVAYMTYDEEAGTNSWQVKKRVGEQPPVLLGENMYPVALSDDGVLVYAISVCVSDDGTLSQNGLVVFKENESRVLGEAIYVYSERYRSATLNFNEDCSQVLFDNNDGIFFSRDGEAATLLNSSVYLMRPKSILKDDSYSIDKGLSDTRLSYSVTYTGTKNLYRLVFSITSENQSFDGWIWYFTEDLKSVPLTPKSWSSHFEQVDQSILTYRYKELVFVEDIYKPEYEDEYDSSDEFLISDYATFHFLLTSDKKIFYYADGYLHSLESDGQSEPFVISSGCIGMQRFVREGKPDFIYYLEIKDLMLMESSFVYQEAKYFDLYMIEDVPGASPVLVDTQVSEFECGDFGVYYFKLNKIAPRIAEIFAIRDSDRFIKEYRTLTADQAYDTNSVYCSKDGDVFTKKGEIEKIYISLP